MHPLDHIMKKRLSHAHTPVESYNWDKISEKLDGIDNQKPKHIFLRSTLGTASIICLLLISGFLGFNIYDSSQVLPLAIKNTHTSDHTNKVSPIAFSTTTGSSHSSSTFQQSSTSRESIKQRSTSFTNPVQNDIANNLNELSIESNNLTSPNTIQQTSNAINKPNIFNTKAQSSTISTLDNRLIESKSISNATRQSAVIDHLSIMTSLPSSTNRKLEILPLLTNSIVSIDSDLGARKTYRKLNNKVSQKTIGGCPFTFETNNKSLEVFVSHDLYQKSLSMGQPIDAGLLDMRKESVVDQYSYTVGARFGYNLSNRWRLHLGASYSQQNEKFSYIDPESNQERFITIKDYVYENGRIVDSVITTEKVIIPGTTVIQKNNKYSSFDIPVIARFTVFGTKDLSISATLGPIFNISYDQKGTIIGDDLKPQRLEDYNGYKTQLGVRLYGGFSLAYHVAGDLDLVFEPHAKMSLQDVTKDKALVQQRNQVFGLHTGLRYRF